MTKRERVIAALSHKETDFVPYTVDLTGQAFDNLKNYLGRDDFYADFGTHMSGAGFATETAIEGRPGYVVDCFGVCWNRTADDGDFGVIDDDDILIKEPDISLFTAPEPDAAYIKADMERLMLTTGDTFKFAGIGFSMFERAWTLRGMENLLMDMLLEEDFAHALLDKICEFNLKVLDCYLQYPVDGIYFGDDWGQQKGLIMGPELWRKFIKPQMKKMYEKCKSAGKFVLQHSCGDISEIYPDLIEIGLDAHQTFQPEIFDIDFMKKEYGGDITFWGGISTQHMLPFETPQGVKEETRKIINKLKGGGGLIISPTHGIPGDVPPENILALVEVFQNQN